MTRLLKRCLFWAATVVALIQNAASLHGADASDQQAASWKLGTPIVSYWASPPMTDALAQQMADGGWNLIWCTTEKELDIAQRHGLRGQFHNGLISAASLDNPENREKLDALVARVRMHPALYSYYVMDEPNTADFPALGRIVSYLRQRDPAHLAYVNLFPTYASNKQLGVEGETASAYAQHLRQFIDVVKPSLLSYDHYQFTTTGDTGQYFLNLALVRQAAQRAGLPLLNIVQSCSWDPSRRVPNANEMRYLVYTTLAYGAQGISYFVYYEPNCKGGIALADGTPTPLYHALKPLNREFVAIATEYQPLRSLGVYHCGMTPWGTRPLSDDAPFRLDPPVPLMPCENLKPIKGMLLGLFGPAGKRHQNVTPTHALVVNLDYTADHVTKLIGPGNLEVFDATSRAWSSTAVNRVELRLPPGGGKLVRIKKP